VLGLMGRPPGRCTGLLPPTGATRHRRRPPTYTSDFRHALLVRQRQGLARRLFDDTGALTVSRLSYDGFSHLSPAKASPAFDLSSGWFLKGYAGGGALLGGQLKDEDFPPVIAPYSATLSPIKKQLDELWQLPTSASSSCAAVDFYIGAFAGYHFMRQSVQRLWLYPGRNQSGRLRADDPRQLQGHQPE